MTCVIYMIICDSYACFGYTYIYSFIHVYMYIYHNIFITLFFHFNFVSKYFAWNKFLTGVTVQKYLYYEKCSYTRAGAQCASIEGKGQRAASWHHRYYTFTLAIVYWLQTWSRLPTTYRCSHYVFVLPF